MDAAKEAGKLLQQLPTIWEEADLSERRRLLTAMLEAVYVDTVEERTIFALRPKPAFRTLCQIATTRDGSGGSLACRMVTICNQLWESAYLACVDKRRHNIRACVQSKIKRA